MGPRFRIPAPLGLHWQVKIHELLFQDAHTNTRVLIYVSKQRFEQNNPSEPRITEVRLTNLQRACEAKKKRAQEAAS